MLSFVQQTRNPLFMTFSQLCNSILLYKWTFYVWKFCIIWTVETLSIALMCHVQLISKDSMRRRYVFICMCACWNKQRLYNSIVIWKQISIQRASIHLTKQYTIQFGYSEGNAVQRHVDLLYDSDTIVDMVLLLFIVFIT